MLTQRLQAPLIALWTRLKRRQLDEEIASGADPVASSALTLRAAQLSSQGLRRRLARGLVKELEDALEPEGFTLRLRPHRAEIRASADDLLDIATRLDDGQPAELRGLAEASLLLTPGASPFDPTEGGGLRRAVRSARLALDPPTKTPKLVVSRPSEETAAAA